VTDWPGRWRGRWIWLWLLTERQPDVVALFRRVVALDQVPAVAPCRVTADGRYQLWVNGALVGRGPIRGEPVHLHYDEYDVAPHLHAGENVIGLVVRRYGRAIPYWKPPTPAGRLGFGSVLLEARLGDVEVGTDHSWRGRVAPYERRDEPGALGVAPPEIIDGRDVPWGWTDSGFDDASWQAAVEIEARGLGVFSPEPPSDPFSRLELNPLPPLAERLVPVTTVAASGDGWTTYDIGEIVNCHPAMEVEADAGTVIELTGGEDIDASGEPIVEPRNWRLSYTAAGRGDEHVEALEPVGLRYVQVRGNATARLSVRERHYPRPTGASFSSSDPVLDAIWLAGARTLDACSTDAFLDCPGREQRAWLGDAYVETMISLSCNPDTGLARWNARLHGLGARPDGLLPMVAGGDFTDAVTIPDYSLHWVRTVARLWDHLAAAELVEEQLPAVLRILAWFERHRGDDGLLADMNGWIFVDWAQTERRRQVAAIDALDALAHGDAATLASAVGDDGTATRLRARADQTRLAFERYWDAERGVYVDAADPGALCGRRVSQQTNALAILCGAAGEERWKAILDFVLDDERLVLTRFPGDFGPERMRYQWLPAAGFHGEPFDEEANVVLAQPFFAHFVHQAVVHAGRRDLMLPLIRRWKPLLDRGNGVFEEYWEAPPGGGSRCHAWSATPTYDLTTHILGVRSTSPGWRTIEVAPFLGDLDRVEGSVPTPLGFVRVSASKDGPVTVDFPEGATGEVVSR
jgi:alpha-L-rhamnosidase